MSKAQNKLVQIHQFIRFPKFAPRDIININLKTPPRKQKKKKLPN